MSFNLLIAIGNLVANPEIRYVGSGAAVTKMRIAINPNKKDAKPEETVFLDVVTWEKLAETCNTYLKKGDPVLFQGRLSIRSYVDAKKKDEDGNPIRRQATELVASQMRMLKSKAQADAAAAVADAFAGAATGDDEIPY